MTRNLSCPLLSVWLNGITVSIIPNDLMVYSYFKRYKQPNVVFLPDIYYNIYLFIYLSNVINRLLEIVEMRHWSGCYVNWGTKSAFHLSLLIKIQWFEAMDLNNADHLQSKMSYFFYGLETCYPGQGMHHDDENVFIRSIRFSVV